MRVRLSNEEFTSRFKEKYGKKLSLVGEYTKLVDKIAIKCNVCGYSWEKKGADILSGILCPVCKQNRRQKRILNKNSKSSRFITKEIFLKRVEECHGDEYELVGEYVNYTTKVRMRHKKCGTIWNVFPKIFTRANRPSKCPFCNRAKVDQDGMQKKLDLKFPNIFKIMEYTGNGKRLSTVKDNRCGHIFKMSLSRLLHSQGYICPECKKAERDIKELRRKTEEIKAINKIIDKQKEMSMKSKFKILWEAQNSFKATIKCPTCNSLLFDGELVNFKEIPTRCPICTPRLPQIRCEDDLLDIIKKYGNEYSLIGRYVSNNEKIEVKHKCGYTFFITPSTLKYKLLKGKRPCIKCHPPTVAKTTEQFQNELDERFGANIYTVLGTYINNVTPIKVKHNCGNVYDVLPDTLLSQNKNTPYCQSCMPQIFSAGERKISEILTTMGINFVPQYRIKECKNIKPLPFDFAIFDNEEHLKMLIEFDGNQHTDAVRAWGGMKNLEDIKKRDKIKNEFCKHASIPLLRIPYKDLPNLNIIVTQAVKNIA